MNASSRVEFNLVATSISSFLLPRLNLIHMDREMGAFAGPPGIGKTSMVDLVKKEFTGDVVVVTPRQDKIKPVLGMLYTLNAIRSHSESNRVGQPSGRIALEAALDNAIKDWAQREWRVHGEQEAPNLTIIFDEAQRFDESFFETIRSWNDAAWSDYLPPVGMVFVGNADFVLKDGTPGASFLSDAVLSRTSYSKTFTYKDLKDRDLTLVLGANGVADPEAVAALLEFCALEDRNRDLRVVQRLVRAAKREADGEEVVARHVHAALGLKPDLVQERNARQSRKRAA